MNFDLKACFLEKNQPCLRTGVEFKFRCEEDNVKVYYKTKSNAVSKLQGGETVFTATKATQQVNGKEFQVLKPPTSSLTTWGNNLAISGCFPEAEAARKDKKLLLVNFAGYVASKELVELHLGGVTFFCQS